MDRVTRVVNSSSEDQRAAGETKAAHCSLASQAVADMDVRADATVYQANIACVVSA